MAARKRWPALVVEPWGDPFAGKKLNRLSQVLREQSHADTNDENPGVKVKAASWTAQLPFVWDLIVEHLVASSEEELATFWQTVLDGGCGPSPV
jgi:DNA polymerase phi